MQIVITNRLKVNEMFFPIMTKTKSYYQKDLMQYEMQAQL